jgi:hypothetical protein
MELNLETLAAAGGFVGAPVKKEVSWKVGRKKHTADVWVRPVSYHSAVGEVGAYRNGQDGMAARIAACIVNEKGEPIFTIGDITGDANPARGPLNHSLTMALVRVIGEVNDVGKDTSSQP